MFRFETPWAFLALLIPVFLWLLKRKRIRPAVVFSSLEIARQCRHSWRSRLQRLPFFCELAAWIILTCALARPQFGSEKILESTRGIAIEMVLDKSTSMEQPISLTNGKTSRFSAVKQVFTNFVFGDGKELQGRPNDLIGLITFARYPDTICPLTLSHETLRPLIAKAEMVSLKSEDGTAIGDALALAAARLKTAEETLENQNKKAAGTYKLTSKIIILLTDGENNCGNRDIAAAGSLAKEWGIKVYAIAVTSNDNTGMLNTPFGRIVTGMSQVDTTELENLAKNTGGIFRLATDRDSLKHIYEEIDQLEHSDIQAERFVNYRELFLPLAGLAMLFIVAKFLFQSTILRTIP